MVGLYCQGEGWLVRRLVDRGVCVVSAICLKNSPAAMRHIWQQAKPIANGSSRFVNVTSGCYIVTLLHCYVCVFPLRLLYSRIRIICKVYSEQ